MSIVVSKLGFHNLGDAHDGTGACFTTIHAAGRQLALVDGHDVFGLNAEAREYWPNILSIGDLTEFEADFDINLLRQHAAQNPWISHWQVYNEINGDWVGQADRLINIMQTYGAEFKFVIFNCADGTPQYPEIDPIPYAQIARACKVAKAGGHLLGLHEYGNDWNGDHLLRYRRLMNYLAAHDALCDIVITEAGPVEAGPFDKDSFMTWCKRYDAELMKDKAVKGAALWTLGGGWYDYHTALPDLADYIVTLPSPGPEPEPMTLRVGVHSRTSGGDLTTTDLAVLQSGMPRINGFKFMTSDARANHGRVKNLGIDPINCIVRLFWQPEATPPTSDHLRDIFSLPISEALTDGITWFEFLNEPNLVAEWPWSVDQFCTIAKETITKLRALFPTANFLTPGLSPNAQTVPTWDAAFQSSGLYTLCQGIGIHAYGTKPEHLNDDNELRYYRRFASRLTSTQKIWLTEVSLKNYSVTPTDVGKLYGEYVSTLESYVAACYFFTLQGADFAASGEEWVSHAAIPIGLRDYVPLPDEQWVIDWWDLDGQRINGASITFTMDRDHVLTPHAKKVLPPPDARHILTVNDCPEFAGLSVTITPPDLIYDAGQIVEARSP